MFTKLPRLMLPLPVVLNVAVSALAKPDVVPRRTSLVQLVAVCQLLSAPPLSQEPFAAHAEGATRIEADTKVAKKRPRDFEGRWRASNIRIFGGVNVVIALGIEVGCSAEGRDLATEGRNLRLSEILKMG
ncbi:MAG TPA: hypothetical protein VK985_08905 [Rariglobus sp.]|nr:hypothetical protein [Rariglobus sp.]